MSSLSNAYGAFALTIGIVTALAALVMPGFALLSLLGLYLGTVGQRHARAGLADNRGVLTAAGILNGAILLLALGYVLVSMVAGFPG